MLDSSIFRTEQMEFVMANFVEAETELITIQTPTTFGVFVVIKIGDELEPSFSNATSSSIVFDCESVPETVSFLFFKYSLISDDSQTTKTLAFLTSFIDKSISSICLPSLSEKSSVFVSCTFDDSVFVFVKEDVFGNEKKQKAITQTRTSVNINNFLFLQYNEETLFLSPTKKFLNFIKQSYKKFLILEQIRKIIRIDKTDFTNPESFEIGHKSCKVSKMIFTKIIKTTNSIILANPYRHNHQKQKYKQNQKSPEDDR